MLAPVPERRTSGGCLGKRDFPIDLEAGTVSCPGGRTRPITSRPCACGQRGATSRRGGCGERALMGARLDSRGRRAVRIEPREDLLLAGLAGMADPEAAEDHRRGRPRIERLIGLLAHRYHARKSRYLGRRTSVLRAAWSAALVNLNPIGAALRARNASW